MPPFVTAECPKCKRKNRYDLAELRKDGGIAFRGTVYRAVETDEEWIVTCEKCGHQFKMKVPHDLASGGSHADVEK